MLRRAMAVCAAVLGIAVAIPAFGIDVRQYVGVLDPDSIEAPSIPVHDSCPWEIAIRGESCVDRCRVPVLDPKPIDLDCEGEDAGDPRCPKPKPKPIHVGPAATR